MVALILSLHIPECNSFPEKMNFLSWPDNSGFIYCPIANSFFLEAFYQQIDFSILSCLLESFHENFILCVIHWLLSIFVLSTFYLHKSGSASYLEPI